MTRNIRGRNNRARQSTLPTFLASDAPPALKVEALDILEFLEAYPTLDEALLHAERPTLLARIEALTPAGFELFRALRLQPPSGTTCSRPNVAASLREMWRKHGTALDATAYPPGHVVPVMAWVYWGSIAAWAAARPGRAQQPKYHWRQRATQLAALRGLALSHPGEPITHATLHAAGLHAMAAAISAADLERLASELGIGRELTRRSGDHWTAEAVIDAYAALCQKHGVTLSSHALSGIGGEACTLRAQAAKLFGPFRVFQQAVRARHPGIKPPQRPTAANGTLLDSWGEVVTYDALRRAFPDVAITVHVRLPGGTGRCSVDFLLRWVHVEVLGIAEAAMAAARTTRQRKYASQWRHKRSLYAAMGVTPVVVEPADVDAPLRMAARMAEVGQLLAVQPMALPPPCGKTLRAKGHWTFEALCAAVAEVAAAVEGFPTNAQLIAAGYGHAVELLKRSGVRQRVAQAIGCPLRHVRGEWTRERVVAELTRWVMQHGRYPTRRDLDADKQGGLARAAKRLFKGEQASLRALVERRCGRTLPRRQAAPGSYAGIDRLGRFPTAAEMRAAGLPDTLYDLVSRRHGVRRMAAYMGVPYAGPQSLTRAAALALFRSLPGQADPQTAAGAPSRLTTTVIRAALGSRGLAILRRSFGGIAALRAALAEEVEAGAGAVGAEVTEAGVAGFGKTRRD